MIWVVVKIGRNKPERQHHVPKVYLRNFVAKDNSIAVCDVRRGKIFTTGLEAVGVEKNFYTLDKLDDPYCWEKFYATGIEPFMAATFTQVCSKCNLFVPNRKPVIDAELKSALALIMTVQFFRGKHCRKYEWNIYKRELPSVERKVRKIRGRLTTEEVDFLQKSKQDDFFFKRSAMEVSTDPKRMIQFTEFLVRRQFVVYRILGEGEFITSDQPVMFTNFWTGNVKPFSNGLIKPETIIYYPLTPKLLTCAFHPDSMFSKFGKRDGTLIDLDAKAENGFLHSVNKKQSEQCYSQVYSRSEETLQSLFGKCR